MNSNKYKSLLLLLIIVALFNNTIIFAQAVQYTTTANGLDKFKQTSLITTTLSPTDASIATIQMDASKGFQKMEGFGFALNGGSVAFVVELTTKEDFGDGGLDDYNYDCAIWLEPATGDVVSGLYTGESEEG